MIDPKIIEKLKASIDSFKPYEAWQWEDSFGKLTQEQRELLELGDYLHLMCFPTGLECRKRYTYLDDNCGAKAIITIVPPEVEFDS